MKTAQEIARVQELVEELKREHKTGKWSLLDMHAWYSAEHGVQLTNAAFKLAFGIISIEQEGVPANK